MNAKLVSARGMLRAVVAASVVSLATGENAWGVAVSASYSGTQSTTNHMGLPPVGAIFDPGTPDFGFLGLVAPGFGTNSVSIPFAYPANAPNPVNAVQMYGDAVSSITNLGAGVFQAEIIITNFFIDQGTPAVTGEYVYLNAWETFTGLGLPANFTWSTAGTISVNGPWSAGAASFVAIEPAAIAFDSVLTTWDQASPFFGATGTGPGGGLLIGSQSVTPLTNYVAAGQLSVGVQTILQLKDPLAVGGNIMHLPTSLHLSITMTPVPEPSTLALAASAVAGCGVFLIGRVRRKSRNG